MKIGIDARFIGPEGTGLSTYTQNLIENLQKIDDKNHYSIFLHKNNWQYLKITNKNFTKVLANISLYLLSEQIKMPQILKSQNLDLLHIPHFNVPIFYSGKFIVTIHDLIHNHFPQTTATTQNLLLFRLKRIGYHRIFKNAVTRSAKIITPSNFVKEDLITTFKLNPSKIAVTYESAEEVYFSSQKPYTINHTQSLIYVGNAYPHKNLNSLLDALSVLNFKFKISRQRRGSPKATNLKLIIVCPRGIFASRLTAEIEKRNLKNKIELLGWQNPQ